MNAALAVSASLRPAVKKYIISQRLMGPTMQWIFRRNFKGVKTQEDYLSSKAHPVVFTTNILDVVSMVKHAHSLKIEDIPPAAAVNVVNSRLFPIKFPQPVVDYPDICGEIIYATPTATAFALRSKEAKRTFLFQAKTYPEHNPLATFEWKVVGGDPSFVKIETPLGERTGPESGIAQITIDRTKLTNRIDIAVFAKNLNSEYEKYRDSGGLKKSRKNYDRDYRMKAQAQRYERRAQERQANRQYESAQRARAEETQQVFREKIFNRI
jgi:hypothetical protein